MSSLSQLDQLLIDSADGEWEREFQFVIQSASNPGWNIRIPLKYHPPKMDKEIERVLDSENDFLIVYWEDNYICGSCSAGKLEDLISALIARMPK